MMHAVRKLDAGRYEVTLPLDAGNSPFAAVFSAAVRAGGDTLELVSAGDVPGAVPPRFQLTYQLPASSIIDAYDRVSALVAKLQNLLAGRKD